MDIQKSITLEMTKKPSKIEKIAEILSLMEETQKKQRMAHSASKKIKN